MRLNEQAFLLIDRHLLLYSDSPWWLIFAVMKTTHNYKSSNDELKKAKCDSIISHLPSRSRRLISQQSFTMNHEDLMIWRSPFWEYFASLVWCKNDLSDRFWSRRAMLRCEDLVRVQSRLGCRSALDICSLWSFFAFRISFRFSHRMRFPAHRCRPSHFALPCDRLLISFRTASAIPKPSLCALLPLEIIEFRFDFWNSARWHRSPLLHIAACNAWVLARILVSCTILCFSFIKFLRNYFL